MRCVRAGAALFLAVAVLAGCGGVRSESQTPADEPGGSTRSALYDEIPDELRVREPRDASGVPPCELLTDDQLCELGLVPGTGRERLREGGNVAQCAWDIAGHRTDVSAASYRVNSANPPFFGVHRLRQEFAEFEPLPDVARHPALRAALTAGSTCTISVAVADDQMLDTSSSAQNATAPGDCTRAIRMAELILSNLPLKR